MKKSQLDWSFSSFIPRLHPLDLVAAEGIEPTSLDYRSSALPLSYTAILECAGNDGALDRFFEKFQQRLKVNPKRRRRCALPPHSKVLWLTRRGSNPHLTA